MVVVAAVKKHATLILGEIGNVATEIMLDSGSSLSLVRQVIISRMSNVAKIEPHAPQPSLVTASGDPLPIRGYIRAPVRIGPLQAMHEFIIVDSLVTPVILGTDFLQENNVALDFSSSPVTVFSSKLPTPDQKRTSPNNSEQDLWRPIWEDERQIRSKLCATLTTTDPGLDVVDECSIPWFSDPETYDIPKCEYNSLSQVVNEFADLFGTKPGMTTMECHYIPTSGCPVKVPPRRIPVHYREEVQRQLKDMLDQGIIEESSSPWMAPMVFVRKKSGDIRLCVDYRELNKKTTKDAYPLPLPDEVQDRLAGSAIFSTLDLQCGYWQMPVHPDDRAKTAFCPGPGMGLYQFTRMPFGLTGAPSSFQRLMDKLFHDMPFVTTYIDDVLIHSATEELHQQHLRAVFQ